MHKHGLLSQCVLSEVYAILRHFCVPRARITMAHLSADHAYCEGILGHVSRSFALIIQELPPSLNVSVMVFYLVLRGLDTVRGWAAALAAPSCVRCAWPLPYPPPSRA